MKDSIKRRGVCQLAKVALVLLGGSAGYLYHAFAGCSMGGCAIAASSCLPVLLGALLGLTLATALADVGCGGKTDAPDGERKDE